MEDKFMATIATHNGTAISIKHNLRDPKWKAKDGHIKEGGIYEVMIHKDLKQTYHLLFEKVCQEHDSKQTRSDRKWGSYYEYVKDNKKLNLVYEMIVGVYPEEGEQIDEKEQHTILLEFLQEFQEENPNLYVTGAYYHADEANPHIHIDYVPIVKENGEIKGTGLTKALNQQGIEAGKSIKETPQIRWEKRENDRLTRICEEHQILVKHPIRDGQEPKRRHKDIKTYKAEMDIKDTLKSQNTALQGQIEDIKDKKKNLEKSYEVQKKVLENDLDKITQETKKAQQERVLVQNGLNYDMSLRQMDIALNWYDSKDPIKREIFQTLEQIRKMNIEPLIEDEKQR
jgi:hypothetical protein